MMSATWVNPSVRRRCFGAFGEKRASGSSPSTCAVGEIAGAGAAENDRPVLGRADE